MTENKNYTWSLTDKFELTGEQFGVLLHSFRAIISTPEAQAILMADKANSIMQELMRESIEKGIIKEEKEN